MILKTNQPVTYNKPMAGTSTEVLIGKIKNISRIGDEYFGANYVYTLEDGQVVISDAFELKSKEEIITLNDLIKTDLPDYDNTPEPEFEDLKHYLAFRLKMFELLSPMNPDLLITDIDIYDLE